MEEKHEEEEYDEGFGAEGEISFDEDTQYEYDENNLAPTSFSKWFDNKISQRTHKLPIPVQLPKEEEKNFSPPPPPPHPLKWAKFTKEEEIESTMVVIGRIPINMRRRSAMVRGDKSGEKSTLSTKDIKPTGTNKKRNYAFASKKPVIQQETRLLLEHRKKIAVPVTKPPAKPPQNQFCFSITKGIECPHYSCTYIHHYSQIEECNFKNECKFALKVDDELYIRNNNGRCTKRHVYESIESYLLRLEIKIYNCTSLVLKVRSETHSDPNILRRILESAKSCCVSSLVWQKKKLEDDYRKSHSSPSCSSGSQSCINEKEEILEEGDDEWITIGRSIFQ
jgi:hypothetical protein